MPDLEKILEEKVVIKSFGDLTGWSGSLHDTMKGIRLALPLAIIRASSKTEAAKVLFEMLPDRARKELLEFFSRKQIAFMFLSMVTMEMKEGAQSGNIGGAIAAIDHVMPGLLGALKSAMGEDGDDDWKRKLSGKSKPKPEEDTLEGPPPKKPEGAEEMDKMLDEMNRKKREKDGDNTA